MSGPTSYSYRDTTEPFLDDEDGEDDEIRQGQVGRRLGRVCHCICIERGG